MPEAIDKASEVELVKPGFAYPVIEVCITPAHQAKKLGCCEIDPALYGTQLDIVQLGVSALFAMKKSGVSIVGQQHVTQGYRAHAPIALGETLTVHGVITEVEETPRGRIVHSAFDYKRPDGSIPVSVVRSGLRPDTGGKSGAAAKTPKPAEDLEGFKAVLRRTLQPQNVASYSDEAGNLIHSDIEVARKFGFRAPTAAGLMALEFMMAFLQERGLPARFDLDARFLRPMFWDDAITLYARDEADGTIALKLVNAEGKATSSGIARL